MPVRLKALLYVSTTSAIWGVASIVIKFTLAAFSPLVFLWYRFLISSFVILFDLKNTIKLLKSKYLTDVFMYSVLSGPLGLFLLFEGVKRTEILNLSIIQLVSPPLSAFFAYLVLKERITKTEKTGFYLSISGAFLITFSPLLQKASISGSFSGNLFLFGYLMCDIISLLYLKRLVRNKVNSLTLTNIGFFIGFLVFTPFVLLNYSPENLFMVIKNADFKYHLGVIFMAIFSGTIAFSLRAKAQKTLKVEEIAMFSYLIPIISTPLAIFFLSEKVSLWFLIGGITSVIGVFLAESKHLKLKNILHLN